MFSTVISPKEASWKVVVPSCGMRWRMTKGSPASTRFFASSSGRSRQAQTCFLISPGAASLSSSSDFWQKQ